MIRDVTWTPGTPVRGRPVTFTGNVADAGGARWRWTLRRADRSVASTSSEVGGFTYAMPPGEQNYTITLEVTGPGGEARPMTKQVTTTAELTPQIDSLDADSTTPGTGQRVTFTATESVAKDRGVWTWEITDADTGAPVTGPANGQPARPFAFTFTNAGRYRTRLTVSFDGASDQRSVDVTVVAMVDLTVNLSGTGSGTVTGPGLSCAGRQCTGRYRQGAAVSLTAAPDGNSAFTGWTGCSSVNGPTCTAVLNQPTTVAAGFRADPLAPFAGTWVNRNANPPDLTRVQLDRATASTMTLHVWGACVPTDCDWDTTTATLVGGELHASYVQSFATRTIRISRSGSQLVVQCHTHFTDNSGRKDYDITDIMNRA
jgi:hypothetical protein